MKTISIRLEDLIYEELGIMLNDMGQTKQTFYETYTRTVLKEGCIPFIIKASLSNVNTENSKKMKAFEELEAFRKNVSKKIDSEKEREAI